MGLGLHAAACNDSAGQRSGFPVSDAVRSSSSSSSGGGERGRRQPGRRRTWDDGYGHENEKNVDGLDMQRERSDAVRLARDFELRA